MTYDPDYVPSGPNNEENEYYKTFNNRRIARADYNRTEFFGTIGGVPQDFTVTLTGLTNGAAQILTEITAEVTWSSPVGTITGYQWLAGSTAIPGATSASYTVELDYDTQTLRCEVTTTEYGTGLSKGARIQLPAPVNNSAPHITPEDPEPTDTLTTTDGVWSNAAVNTTTSYRWYVNDVATNVIVNSIDANDYKQGSKFKCVVTKTNSGGSTPASSNEVTTKAYAPVNTTAPSYPTTTGVVGNSITVIRGTWTNDPTGYAYKHYLGGVEQPQVGTAQTFVPDAEGTWYSTEAAENEVGFGTYVQTSNSAVITAAPPAPPVNVTAPSIPATGDVDTEIVATAGVWTGYPPPLITRQWYLDNVAISGATDLNYTPTAVGNYRIVETANNASGEDSSSSEICVVDDGITLAMIGLGQ